MVELENLDGGAVIELTTAHSFGASLVDTSRLDEAGLRALGWKALTELIAETGGKSRRTFDRLMKGPREAFSDQFQRVVVPPQRGGSSLMISPLMYQLLLQKFNDSKPRKDWKSDYDLAASLGVDRSTVGKAARVFTALHPEWVEYRQLDNGKFANVYDPQLCKILMVKVQNKNRLRCDRIFKEDSEIRCSSVLSWSSFSGLLIR